MEVSDNDSFASKINSETLLRELQIMTELSA